MTKLKIGVHLEVDKNMNAGGISAYYERLIDKINNYTFDDKIEVVFLLNHHLDHQLFKKPVIEIPEEKINAACWTPNQKRWFNFFSLGAFKNFMIHERIERIVQQKIEYNTSRFFADHKIDLIYYPVYKLLPYNYPFINTIWDAGHKNMFYLDYFNKEKFKHRKMHHDLMMQLAFAFFVESEQTREDLWRFEHIPKEKTFIVSLFAGKLVELNVDGAEQKQLLAKWGVANNPFYFYPAQFWGHKNHFGLIKALKLVLKEHPEYKLVLSGTDKGNMAYIKHCAELDGILENIVFTGFATNEEVYTFYKNAIALVFPTLLGPTNMPLLEAYYLGCKVICSDFEGHRQQLGHNALYIDPLNHEDIAKKMLDVITLPKPQEVSEPDQTAAILNEHFLTLYNIRKTFGYDGVK